jgi:hypothetical protein
MFYFGTYIYVLGSIQPLSAHIKEADAATQHPSMSSVIVSPMQMPDFAGDYRRLFLSDLGTNYYLNMGEFEKIWNTPTSSEYEPTAMPPPPHKKNMSRRKLRYQFLMERRAQRLLSSI